MNAELKTKSNKQEHPQTKNHPPHFYHNSSLKDLAYTSFMLRRGIGRRGGFQEMGKGRRSTVNRSLSLFLLFLLLLAVARQEKEVFIPFWRWKCQCSLLLLLPLLFSLTLSHLYSLPLPPLWLYDPLPPQRGMSKRANDLFFAFKPPTPPFTHPRVSITLKGYIQNSNWKKSKSHGGGGYVVPFIKKRLAQKKRESISMSIEKCVW